MKTLRSDVHLVNRDDVIALLEDGPHHAGELRDWLGLPTPTVDAALKAMHKIGLVKRVGVERRWALHAYEDPTERPHLKKGASPPARAKRQATPMDEQTVLPPLKVKTGGSWWCGLDRLAFTKGLAARHAIMRVSPDNRLVPLRILQ